MADAVTPLFAPAFNGHTFETAAASYLAHGGHNERYLPPIIDWFGDRPLAGIAPFDVREMAEALYPTQSGATRNRQALTPARAVLSHAYERGWAPLMRIRNFRQDRPKRKKPASQAWLQIFCRECEKTGLDHLAACVMFMSHTGARVSEAVELLWPEVDLPGRRVTLLRTKTTRNSVRFLTDELVDRMAALQRRNDRADNVFRYTSRYSVNDRIGAVCRRAGLPYKSSHACGRHSFATNSIAMGMDVRTVMDAGDWRTSSVFLETYVHSRNAGRRVADGFNTMMSTAEL